MLPVSPSRALIDHDWRHTRVPWVTLSAATVNLLALIPPGPRLINGLCAAVLVLVAFWLG